MSTGISSADRARTVAVAVDPASRPHDLVQPGHVFPVRIRDGGLLEHHGANEAAVFCARHGLPLVDAADIAQQRRRTAPLAERIAAASAVEAAERILADLARAR